MSHTKGPWKWEDGYIVDSQQVPYPVASVNAMGSIAESEANARLIAAAPEMLELLQSLVSSSMEAYTAKHKPEDQWDEYDYVMIPQWKQAIDLINKATGAQEDGQ